MRTSKIVTAFLLIGSVFTRPSSAQKPTPSTQINMIQKMGGANQRFAESAHLWIESFKAFSQALSDPKAKKADVLKLIDESRVQGTLFNNQKLILFNWLEVAEKQIVGLTATILDPNKLNETQTLMRNNPHLQEAYIHNLTQAATTLSQVINFLKTSQSVVPVQEIIDNLVQSRQTIGEMIQDFKGCSTALTAFEAGSQTSQVNPLREQVRSACASAPATLRKQLKF